MGSCNNKMKDGKLKRIFYLAGENDLSGKINDELSVSENSKAGGCEKRKWHFRC